MPAVGTRGTLQLTAGNCTWNASTPVLWVVVSLTGTGSGGFYYNIAPNFGTNGRRVIIPVGDRTLTIDQAGATGTPDERFVSLLYYSFFGRIPSTQEIAVQTAALRSMSRTDLTLFFYGSDEFNLVGRFVAGLYVGLLNRDPEFAGYIYQRDALLNGIANPVSITGNFLLSQEFQLQNPNLTDASFVRVMYRQVLLREAKQDEVDFQVREALQKGVSRVQFAFSMLNTPEFRIGTGPRLTAFLLYACLLQREATAIEKDGRARAIASGTPLRDLVSEFVNSGEFLQLLQ
ncbi:MAG: DUF4214 domain-containing protein [Bryobacteraceae bacterium]|nr:DUF4214 domain-containing protein [Bryobacteraceae bacterium]